MKNNNLEEKIERILESFDVLVKKNMPTLTKDSAEEPCRLCDMCREDIRLFQYKSLKQFASDITESMLVEIEDIKIDPLREKREGVRGHIENLIKEAIKAKRKDLLK